MDDLPDCAGGSGLRRHVAVILIGIATAQSLGLAMRTPTPLGVNDISRWCTVWALLERGTYAIDDCPWQHRTVDKVYRTAPFQHVDRGREPLKHFYSSKPPLLPTLIAGLLYPFRAALVVPLDQEYIIKSIIYHEYSIYFNIIYFKPIIILLNVVPFLLFLARYAQLLDRFAIDDWAWLVSLTSAAWGTPLFAFNSVLNNHTVAAYSAFFALDACLRIGSGSIRSSRLYVAAGFFTAFCACNELPATMFAVVVLVDLLRKHPGMTLRWFVPAAAVPCAAFLVTLYLATGGMVPVYAEAGTASYMYPGSYWLSPRGLDSLNENKFEYFLNFIVGHHGVFSLTPVFLFSVLGVVRLWRGPQPLASLARLAALLTVTMFAFYVIRTNNYGGMTQGLRWVFWLFPFWLLLLPWGLEAIGEDVLMRRCSLAVLLVSVFSVGYALPSPWSHPWLLDLMEILGECP